LIDLIGVGAAALVFVFVYLIWRLPYGEE
jgi:hypothetical protein